MNVSIERVPPQAVDAERAVLGALMLAGNDTGLLAEVGEILKPNSFYNTAHRYIFQACLDLSVSDSVVDLVTVITQLEKNGKSEQVGGIPYLDEMIESCPSSANAVHYAKIVQEAAIRRYLVVTGAEISNLAQDDTIETEEVISRAEQAVMEVRAPESREKLVHIKGVIKSAFDRVNKLYHSGESIIGLSTGFPELDRKLGGLQDGQYVIIGGRPGMGKSGWVQNLMHNVSIVNGEGSVLFTLETSKEAFTMRLLSQASGIDFEALKSGHIKDTDFPALTIAAGKITGAPLWIDSTGGISPMQIKQRLRQLQRHMDIRLIVIDYLQLMTADVNTTQRVDTLTEISRGVKALAQDFGCPLIAVSQLSRKVEERPDKRPQLHDLRESGALEQDADLVAFIYREGYYESTKDPKQTEFIIAKNKDGPVGKQQFNFDMKTMTFKETSW